MDLIVVLSLLHLPSNILLLALTFLIQQYHQLLKSIDYVSGLPLGFFVGEYNGEYADSASQDVQSIRGHSHIKRIEFNILIHICQTIFNATHSKKYVLHCDPIHTYICI